MSPPTVFLAPAGPIVSSGPVWRESLPAGDLPAALAARCLSPDGAPVAFAALPFDVASRAVLVHPERLAPATAWTDEAAGPAPARGARLVDGVSPASFAAAVTAVLEDLRKGDARKVVLSRHLTFEFEAPVDVLGLLRRLHRDPAATTFCLPLEPGYPQRALVGASPELLIEKQGARICSAPLAGSAARVGAPALDRHAADCLTRSEKDGREHAIVVEWIADRLAPYCRTLSVPSTPSLAGTRTMWHLASRLDGVLKDPATPSVELALALHPTPAVGGVPHAAALDLIARLEPVSRRFYAGAVGWTDAHGDGRWMVAIRSVEIDGRRACVHAGAGIVEGSDPRTEAAETSAKLTTVLSALGIDEQGGVARHEW